MARSSRVPSGRLLDSQGSIELLTQTDTVRMSDTNIKSLSIDDNFVDTYGLKLAAGRNYEKERGTDKNAFLINQAGAKNVGFENAEDAVGKYIRYGGQTGYIVGVVENFNFESLHQNIQPMIFINLKTINIGTFL